MHHNPVKRGLVERAELWAWSSYRVHAFGEHGRVKMDWLFPPSVFRKPKSPSGNTTGTGNTHPSKPREGCGTHIQESQNGNKTNEAKKGAPPAVQVTVGPSVLPATVSGQFSYSGNVLQFQRRLRSQSSKGNLHCVIRKEELMIAFILLCASFVALSVGTVAHFRILAQLEQSGIEVKYFATVGDNLRAYKAYRNLGKQQSWPIWPVYAVFASYAGVIVAGLAFCLGSPISWIMK